MQEKFIQVDGNKIRYLESGDSKNTLVLIHGLGASAERWSLVIPILAKYYRVIAPDLIGYGYSDKPILDYSPEMFVNFLGKFFDALQIKCPIIIGSSLGGQISAEYTSANPKNVKKLVLVSPAGAMKQSTPALDAYIMAALYPNEQSAKNAFELMEASGNNVSEKIVQGFIERMQLPNSKLAFMSTILGMKNSEIISPKLHTIQCPTLVIWGVNDPVVPVEFADGFVSFIKDCEFHKMEKCGHTPYVQDPETFLSIVLGFLLK
ncbi:alpha/beta hydrolase [Candidatus Nitrosarchaeum limnium SFB1]|uniref:Alpha/beta hydrolase n=1 Tax=Candidatus Nitrosarchaeum limnium SFB1 TaxID=886738 RepID=F3KJN0_9ARCH|nr:alpha/beta hydrolase [Candidatus Nitrosarchaeum limnium SFB1]